jgi:hypothetical protein
MFISVEGTGKNQLRPDQEKMRNAPVLSHFSLPRYPRTRLTGVLEHCHEGETNCWFSIFQVISF